MPLVPAPSRNSEKQLPDSPNHRLHKRRLESSDKREESDFSATSTTDSDDERFVQRGCKKQRLSSVKPPSLIYPKSLYNDHDMSQPRMSERAVLIKLLANIPPGDDKYISLSNFCIYRSLDSSSHPGVMAPLNDLSTKRKVSWFQFNGILSVGSQEHYIEGVPFKVVSVEGYETSVTTVKHGIYIQSIEMEDLDIWYKLKQPAPEYLRFYEAYLWLADFGKHFVCYLLEHDDVSLQSFKSLFYAWLRVIYKKSHAVQEWLSQYTGTDFRSVVVSHYEYLWKESTSIGVEESARVTKHILWSEVDPDQLGAVPRQDYPIEAKTLVTPYVFGLFKDMYFGDALVSTQPEVISAEDSDVLAIPAVLEPVQKVEIGDVVCVERDEHGHWKDQASTWFAYVHDIENLSDGQKQLHLFWVYRPSETPCGQMKYPCSNELFLSDHCNCKCNKASRVFSSDVRGRLSVSLFTSSAPRSAFFIRTTFITEHDLNHFITLEKSHLTCEHRKGRRSTAQPHKVFPPGKTVLVRSSNQVLEPVIIIGWHKDGKHAQARKLLRKGRDLSIPTALPNELVYTSTIQTVAVASIVRECHVRCYSDVEVMTQKVPTPYCLGGVGDCWIITSQLSTYNAIEPLPTRIDFMQGFNPTDDSTEALPTLDLFCGSGSFGRGLQEGKAAKVRWAVDIDKFAIHTKRANLTNVDDTALFLGSAVDYFERAASGRFSGLIAMPTEVAMIIAGSPCQGFSALQSNTDSSRSKRNASMVALVVAFIDLYRPRYALLENVFGMIRKFGPNKDEDVFAQIVCALVGIGYQVRYYLIDAFSHGSPQNRSRIFLSVAAPGLTPIECPPITHEAPSTAYNRSIGRSLAGVSFGSRVHEQTPFKYVSAEEATKDLPDISNVNLCIQFPDHRVVRSMGAKKRILIQCIPRFPRLQGFITSVKGIPEAALGVFEKRVISKDIKHPKIWQRVHPYGLFDTITTAVKPDDIKSGRWLHWDQHRIVTVMEARRAQSFRDETILIGPALQQWKLVGNAVSFNVATALGLSLRRALLRNSGLLSDYQISSIHISTSITAAIVINNAQLNNTSLNHAQPSDITPESDSDDPLSVARPSLVFESSLTGTQERPAQNHISKMIWPKSKYISPSDRAKLIARGDLFIKYVD